MPAFGQRFGIYDESVRQKLSSPPARVWIHAVSVGEIQVALRFMTELRAEKPAVRFILTTTTSTAHALAGKMMSRGDLLLYFPIDFPLVIGRVLRRLNPAGLVLVESELWPNLVRQAASRRIPVMLLNGRISNRSFRGYRFLRPLVRRILAHFTILCAQSKTDAGRLIELGADPERVRVTGSAKYDIAGVPCPAGAQFAGNLRALGFGEDKLLFVGGSTWPGEEAALLEIFIKLRGRHPGLRLVLVPRHAERRKEVMAEIAASGLACRLWSEASRVIPRNFSADENRVRVAGNSPFNDVLLVDTTGELRAFYAAAAVVFIGKSLAARGGQNPIEAAACSKPVVAGPHMENFDAVVADFLEAGAIVRVGGAGELEQVVGRLLGDAGERRLIGERARRVVLEKSGALRASTKFFLDSLSADSRHVASCAFRI